ncbi:hypothetical protein J6590_070706, partial [Homalodisca vitripennis]
VDRFAPKPTNLATGSMSHRDSRNKEGKKRKAGYTMKVRNEQVLCWTTEFAVSLLNSSLSLDMTHTPACPPA